MQLSRVNYLFSNESCAIWSSLRRKSSTCCCRRTISTTGRPGVSNCLCRPLNFRLSQCRSNVARQSVATSFGTFRHLRTQQQFRHEPSHLFALRPIEQHAGPGPVAAFVEPQHVVNGLFRPRCRLTTRRPAARQPSRSRGRPPAWHARPSLLRADRVPGSCQNPLHRRSPQRYLPPHHVRFRWPVNLLTSLRSTSSLMSSRLAVCWA